MEKERTKEKKRTMEYEKPVVVDLGSECGRGDLCVQGSMIDFEPT